jgi:hypothetical protein
MVTGFRCLLCTGKAGLQVNTSRARNCCLPITQPSIIVMESPRQSDRGQGGVYLFTVFEGAYPFEGQGGETVENSVSGRARLVGTAPERFTDVSLRGWTDQLEYYG